METDNGDFIDTLIEYNFFEEMVILCPLVNMENKAEILNAMVSILEVFDIEQRKRNLQKIEEFESGPIFYKLINCRYEPIRSNARQICNLCEIGLEGTIYKFAA